MIDPRRSLYPRPKLDQVREPEGETSHALMLDMVGVGKRILELGCSNGFMSRLLKQRNCQVTGVEVDPLAAAEARAFCEEVIIADLDTRPLVDLLPGTPFDAAIFGDVLEHLRDPWRVLDEARAFLAPGSFVVLSIPNIAHGSVRLALLRGSFDYQPQGLLDATHLRFFTLRSVRELCMRSGYRIEEIRRTKADLFTATDLLPQVDPNDFDEGLIAQVRADPEHDTVQFIVKAVPLNDEERISEIASRVSTLESELHAANEKSARLQVDLDALREEERQAAESELLDELRDRREDVAGLTAALASSQAIRDALAADLRYKEAKVEELESIRDRMAQLEREHAVLVLSSEREHSALEEERKRSNDLDLLLEQTKGALRDLQGQFDEKRVALEVELERTNVALRELQGRFDEKRAALEAELFKLNSDRIAFEASVARLHRSAVERTRSELRKVLEEIALTDAAIQATYRSRLWALKRMISLFRVSEWRRKGRR